MAKGKGKARDRRSSNDTALDTKTFSILAFKTLVERDIADGLQISEGAVFVESFLPWGDDKSALVVSFFSNPMASDDRDTDELARELAAKITRRDSNLTRGAGRPRLMLLCPRPPHGMAGSWLFCAMQAMRVEDTSQRDPARKVRIILSGDCEHHLTSSFDPHVDSEAPSPRRQARRTSRHSTGTLGVQVKLAVRDACADGEASPSPARLRRPQASSWTHEVSTTPLQRLAPPSQLRESPPDLRASFQVSRQENLADFKAMKQAIAASRACRASICAMLHRYGIQLELQDLASGC
eukprot:754939-Hanusia_phi.AAC.2